MITALYTFLSDALCRPTFLAILQGVLQLGELSLGPVSVPDCLLQLPLQGPQVALGLVLRANHRSRHL